MIKGDHSGFCEESTAGGRGWEQKAGTVTRVEGNEESWDEGCGEALVMGMAGETRSLVVAQRGGGKQDHTQDSAPSPPHTHIAVKHGGLMLREDMVGRSPTRGPPLGGRHCQPGVLAGSDRIQLWMILRKKVRFTQ